MGGQAPPQDAFFEDFQIGQEMKTQEGTITESDVMTFAGLSGDHHPIHIDEAYASQQFYGRRIAHGMLSLSVATGLKTL